MSGTWLTPSEDKRVKTLYSQGWSQQQIAEDIGRTRNAVARSLKRQGVESRSLHEGHKAWRAKLGHQVPAEFKKAPEPLRCRYRAVSVFQLGAM
jgi:IS30 family transposase